MLNVISIIVGIVTFFVIYKVMKVERETKALSSEIDDLLKEIK